MFWFYFICVTSHLRTSLWGNQTRTKSGALLLISNRLRLLLEVCRGCDAVLTLHAEQLILRMFVWSEKTKLQGGKKRKEKKGPAVLHSENNVMNCRANKKEVNRANKKLLGFFKFGEEQCEATVHYNEL